MQLPADFWLKERAEQIDLLRPVLQEIAIEAVGTARRELSQIGVLFGDEGLAHAEAARWARKYTDQLVDIVSATNEKVIGELVATWAETPGSTIQQLTDQLKTALDTNEVRAAMIATTEVTRAFSNGTAIAYEQAGLPRTVFPPPGHPRCRCFPSPRRLPDGKTWVILWQTNRDEAVCTTPIATPWGETVAGCRDLNTRIISEGPFLGKKFTEVQ